MFSHRASWELYVGSIPDDKCVLHRCDNPACVNPHHLFIGTNQDNINDMVKKGRNAFGVKRKNSKINDEIALKIKNSDNKNAMYLSSIFGISRQSVTDILHGRTWSHV
jgi:HNH endonuclease